MAESQETSLWRCSLVLSTTKTITRIKRKSLLWRAWAKSPMKRMQSGWGAYTSHRKKAIGISLVETENWSQLVVCIFSTTNLLCFCFGVKQLTRKGIRNVRLVRWYRHKNEEKVVFARYMMGFSLTSDLQRSTTIPRTSYVVVMLAQNNPETTQSSQTKPIQSAEKKDTLKLKHTEQCFTRTPSASSEKPFPFGRNLYHLSVHPFRTWWGSDTH